MKKYLLENYIRQILVEASRNQSFEDLIKILKSQKVNDGDTSQKIVIYDKIYGDLLRASRYRNTFHAGNFNQLKNIIQDNQTKKNIVEAIAYFKSEIESLPADNVNKEGSWCQINIDNYSEKRSITRGQLDDEEVSQGKASHVLRTHQMYFTLQHKDLQFDKKLSKAKLKASFGEHISSFADAMLELKDLAESNNLVEKMQHF